MEALGTIAAAMEKVGFGRICCMGLRGVERLRFICGDAAVVGCRDSALLLVPEIGLTPAMAGQMFAAFGARWRCCIRS